MMSRNTPFNGIEEEEHYFRIGRDS